MRAVLLMLVLSFCASPALAGEWEKYRKHKRYDPLFSKYSKRYFGVLFDWRYFKAQAVAESNLNADAKSWVGARGIMQIMPATYEEIRRKDKLIQGSVTDPRWNIAAGISYNRSLYDFWYEDRTLSEKLRFTFGSYNAGKGNVLKAQRRARDQGLNPRIWHSISATLPDVTGKHSQETLNYVRRIEQIKEEID